MRWTVSPSGAATCPSQTFTADTAGAVAVCRAGGGPNGVIGRATVRLDRTPPDVTDAIPARRPNDGGWFTSPVRIDFGGTDATSGVAGCRSVTYSGPDAADASVLGRCRDRAGNASERRFMLSYDGTPPALSGLAATPGDRRVELRWLSGPDVRLVEVLRSPAPESESDEDSKHSEDASVVFSGTGSSFVDVDVQNGVRYRYRVRVSDQAGNRTRQDIAAVPTAPIPHTTPGDPVPSLLPGRRSRLLFPAARATISRRNPPLLRWKRVRRARYYNVQLFRGSHKVLSAWPTRPRYQLRRHWTYDGRTYRLRLGRYRWFVWPGFGARPKARYGDLLGRRSFTVVAR